MSFIRRGSVVLAVLLLSLTAVPAFAQGSSDDGPGVGALGMITRGSVRADGLDDLFDSKTGWGAGLWFGGNKNGLLGFTGELIYQERNVDSGGLDFKTQAIEVPALLRLNIGARSQNGLKVYAVGGPVFTWNLKQTYGGVKLDDSYRNGDIGIMGGIGVEIFRIGIEGRGNWGQRSITVDGNFDEAKNFQFELLGKIRFN